MSLSERVKQIPPTGEWWKPEGEVTFRNVAEAMLAKGFTMDEAIHMLESVYTAVAEEYGE